MTEMKDITLNGIRHGVFFVCTANITKWKDDCENEFSEIRKEVVVVHFKVISRIFLKRIQENKGTHKSE
jgi:hypothetical protein